MRKRKELVTEFTKESLEIDFKTLKEINNDLVGILESIALFIPETETGKKIKQEIEESIEEKIEMIENSTLILIR